jgi:two-component system, OmpR family, sensor kinase
VRIRRRLVLYASGVALLGMVVFVILMGGLLAGGAGETQDKSLIKLADSTVTAVDKLPAGQSAPAMPLILTDLGSSTDAWVEVLASDGTVLYATGQLGGAPPKLPEYKVLQGLETGSWGPDTLTVSGQSFRLVGRKWSHDGQTGLVVAGQATLYATQQASGAGGFLLFSALMTILTVAVVSWLVVGRALRPLRLLATTADEIGRTGDLGRRLPPVRARDEVGALTAAFNGMLDRLAAAHGGLTAALAGQRQFVADASHELRTPLTTIRTNAEFLREHPDVAAADREEAIADIAGESARMSDLVDGLLLLARADAGAPLERRPVDLSALVAEVARKASRGGQPVAATAQKAIVEGDKAALTRLIWILVDNALRHGGGGVEVALTVEAGPAGGVAGGVAGVASAGGGGVGAGQVAAGAGGAAPGMAVLTVADRGPGLPAQEPWRVFDRFYRADAARSAPGSGLGLAIAASIVQAHGGGIQAENRPGGGAVFRVRLWVMAGAAGGTSTP